MFAKEFEPESFKKGEVIFKEGDPSGKVFIIGNGKVEISKMIRGEKAVLAQRGFNTIFGEMSLVDNTPRSATATALEDTWCYVLPAAEFKKRIDGMDSFTQGVVKTLVNTIREMNSRLEEPHQP